MLLCAAQAWHVEHVAPEVEGPLEVIQIQKATHLDAHRDDRRVLAAAAVDDSHCVCVELEERADELPLLEVTQVHCGPADVTLAHEAFVVLSVFWLGWQRGQERLALLRLAAPALVQQARLPKLFVHRGVVGPADHVLGDGIDPCETRRHAGRVQRRRVHQRLVALR